MPARLEYKPSKFDTTYISLMDSTEECYCSSFICLDVFFLRRSLIDLIYVIVVTVVWPDEKVYLLLEFVWSEHKQTSPRHSEQKLAKKGKPGLFGFSTPS